MSDKDPAFQWETEALRTSARRDLPGPTAAAADEAGPGAAANTAVADITGWLTLREAHESTSIPIETLRKWARRGSIPSVLEETEFGTRRLVDPDAVTARATRLGRAVAPIAESEPENTEAAPDKPGVEVEAHAPDVPPEIVDAHPAGTMIVPIDAWDKMLVQLGNLHEAGQQLAEARERAAKAETEAKFLKERLSELRTAASAASPPISPDPEPTAGETTPPATKPATPEGPSEPIGLQEYAKRRWQAWRRR